MLCGPSLHGAAPRRIWSSSGGPSAVHRRSRPALHTELVGVEATTWRGELLHLRAVTNGRPRRPSHESLCDAGRGPDQGAPNGRRSKYCGFHVALVRRGGEEGVRASYLTIFWRVRAVVVAVWSKALALHRERRAARLDEPLPLREEPREGITACVARSSPRSVGPRARVQLGGVALRGCCKASAEGAG